MTMKDIVAQEEISDRQQCYKKTDESSSKLLLLIVENNKANYLKVFSTFDTRD